jgi:hypothetical protein
MQTSSSSATIGNALDLRRFHIRFISGPPIRFHFRSFISDPLSPVSDPVFFPEICYPAFTLYWFALLSLIKNSILHDGFLQVFGFCISSDNGPAWVPIRNACTISHLRIRKVRSYHCSGIFHSPSFVPRWYSVLRPQMSGPYVWVPAFLNPLPSCLDGSTSLRIQKSKPLSSVLPALLTSSVHVQDVISTFGFTSPKPIVALPSSPNILPLTGYSPLILSLDIGNVSLKGG